MCKIAPLGYQVIMNIIAISQPGEEKRVKGNDGNDDE
jgi:hypothetical protein